MSADIAEIIGWERPHLWIYDHEYCTYSCHWCSKTSPIDGGFEPGPSVGCPADAPCSDDQPPQPTADDLLNWLSSSPLSVDGGPDDVEIHRHHFGHTVVRVIDAHSSRPDVIASAPTLVEALEAAVRAVHDAQEATT